jgi:AcrR family transcriptional regulator
MDIAASTNITEPSAPKGKRRLTPEAREAFRNELIGIARHIFLTEGYSAVTIRRITASAGVTPMAFYWYFDSKDALLTLIWDEIILESADVCASVAQQHGSAPDRVVAYFQCFVDYWLAHRDYFRFIFLNESPNVDFVSLRSRLFTQTGVSRHFENYTGLALPLFEGRADAAERVDELKTLSMYKAFGFLHCAIGVYGYSETDAVRYRDLVLRELRHCLDRWSEQPT